MFNAVLENNAEAEGSIVYYTDDQYAFTQFGLSNPHLVSVDSENKMFYSVYKQEHRLRMWFDFDYRVHFNSFKSENIAAIHCNGNTKAICAL